MSSQKTTTKKKLENMHLRERINYGYNKVIMMMLISGLFSIVVIGVLFANMVHYVKNVAAADEAVKICRINVNASARNIREMALNDDTSSYDGYEQTVKKMLTEVDSELKILKKTGTISKENYYLAFFKSNLFCRMVLYKQYCTDAIDFSTSNTYKAYPISSAYVEQNGGNSCSLSLTEAKQITEKYMQTLKITDYTIVQTLDAIRHPQHYTINASFAVEPPAEETEPATDSYLFYASRSLNNLSTLYTSETFSTTLTDYSNAEYDANGGFIFSADESNTFYGFESLTASIDSNGLSYLIWNNPMQVDTIEAKTSPTLSFDQIDAIAKAQIDFMSIWNSSPFDPLSIADCEYTVTSIEYGLIRISDSKHKSYSLVPAWFYMLKPDEAGILYKSSYAIINAIDGSIYNPFIGTLEPTDNSQTEK